MGILKKNKKIDKVSLEMLLKDFIKV